MHTKDTFLRNLNKILKKYKLYVPNNLDTIIAGISILKLIASNCVRIVGARKHSAIVCVKQTLIFLFSLGLSY